MLGRNGGRVRFRLADIKNKHSETPAHDPVGRAASLRGTASKFTFNRAASCCERINREEGVGLNQNSRGRNSAADADAGVSRRSAAVTTSMCRATVRARRPARTAALFSHRHRSFSYKGRVVFERQHTGIAGSACGGLTFKHISYIR